MKYYNILAAAALLALASCGTTKKVADTENPTAITTTQVTPQERAQAIASTYGSWTTLQTGGNIQLGGTKNFSSSINVRMERDKSIYISLRPMLGIEVGRLVFTGDSVIVVDKLHRQYIAENVSLFTNGLPATVSTLQDIFLGRAFVLGEGTYNASRVELATPSSSTGKCNLKPSKQVKGFTYEFTFDEKNNILSLQVVPDGAKSKTYSVDYSEVQQTQAGNIAHSVSVAGTIKGSALNFTLNYNDITWNQAVKIDASIPSNYKRADIRSLSSLLSGN